MVTNLTLIPNHDIRVLNENGMVTPQKTSPPLAPMPISHHRIGLDELASPEVVQGTAYWMALRGNRRFPSREDLSVRAMAPFLKNVALIEVINGGEDYRFRLVGDAHVQARGHDFKGEFVMRDVGARAPGFAARSRTLYDYIRTTGEPYAVRGPMNPKDTDWYLTYRECAFLPLGPRDDLVDYILAVGVYALQACAGHDVQVDGIGHKG